MFDKEKPFNEREIVKHKKNKKMYQIITLPNPKRRLEECNLPFYEYECIETDIRWIRRQDEFEDGRFLRFV